MIKLFKQFIFHKNFLLILLSVVIVSYLTNFSIVFAQQPDVSDFLHKIGEEGELYIPGDTGEFHDRAVGSEADVSEGITIIQTIIFNLLDASKWLLGTASLLLFAVLAIKLIVSGKSEEKITEAKHAFTYALIGFIVIMLADFIVANVFFGAQGEVLSNNDTAKFFARQGSLELQRIYSGVKYFTGSIAVLVIIINGFKMIVSAGEEIDEQKKAIQWAVVGLIIIGLAELIIKEVLFADQGSGLNLELGMDIVIVLTNFITGFVGFISVALVVYAGIMYVLSFSDESTAEKGKKALIAAMIGIIIVAGSYALGVTLVKFAG